MLVLSIGEILGREALVVLVNLSQLMAEKTDDPISRVQGCINSHIAIAVTSLYSCMIYGARLPSPLQDREPYWDPALGLWLAQ